MFPPFPKSAKTALVLAMGIGGGLLQACGGKSLSFEASPPEMTPVEVSGPAEPLPEPRQAGRRPLPQAGIDPPPIAMEASLPVPPEPVAQPVSPLPLPEAEWQQEIDSLGFPLTQPPPSGEGVCDALAEDELFGPAPASGGAAPSPFAGENRAPAPEEPTLLAMEVDDDALAGMRGRFVSNNGNDLLYFGIEMTSQWQTNTGELAIAGVSLAANMPQGQLDAANVQIRPHLTLIRTADPPATPDPAGPNQIGPIRTATLGNNSFASATGVVQSIQVAGDTNQVVNDLYFNIRSQPGGTGQSAASGGTPLTRAGTQELTGDSGTKAAVKAADNNLGVTISVPDQGEVTQQIRGGLGGPGGAILQQARIFSDVNVVHNVITVYAQTAPLSQVRSILNTNIDAAINSLRGLPPP